MAMKLITITVTTTGAAGAATGTGATERPVVGFVHGVYLNWHASAPATTDTTLRTKGNSAPSYNLLVVSNSVTDAFFATAGSPVNSANAAITDAHVPWPVADYLELAIAESDALTNAVVGHVLVDER